MERNSTLFTPKARETKLRRRVLGALAALLVLAAAGAADAMSRIKDIADFEGVRENQLVGYGLVVGLNGTGDRLNNSPFTRQSLIGMLERLGVNTRGLNLKTANIAAVMVTATLPSFARQGRHIDVTISALGDATNLLGGTLLVTPLMGADGEVYAVAQGQLAVGGFAATGASGSSVSQGVPTSARIPNGAIIERESEFDLASLPNLNIALRNPDFTTATRIARAINARVGEPAAEATDPGTVRLQEPDRYQHKVAKLLTEIEQLLVEVGQLNGIAIDEEGLVIASFSNGETQRVFKLPIATFADVSKLEARTGNVYTRTQDSGEFNLHEAGAGGAGVIAPSALEAANVDIGEEFTNMIVTQRAFAASSRVITTVDDMLDELIRIRR